MTATAAPKSTTSARPRGGAVAVAACAAVALASLTLPLTVAFDPWAWLVWGRQVLHLELDTTGGPSWKPLPVAGTTVVALAGGVAPTVWLAVARTLSLLALPGAYRVGSRFAGPWAGAVAAGLLVLTPDRGARFVRLVGEGHSATIGVTCAIWAVERHLAGARSQALLLLTGLALMRPEAWPLLGLYAVWLGWRDPPCRRLAGACLVSIPLLWFGGDWWGSGSPWHGADAAQVASGGAGQRLGRALEHAYEVVALPVWLAAAAGLVLVRDRRAARALAASAGAWILVVVAMATVGGYAALSRFYLPAAVLVCALAGAGAVRLVSLAGSARARWAVIAAVVAVSLPGLAPRAAALDRLYDEARTRHRLDRSLDDAIADAGGRDAALACGAVAIDQRGLAGPLLPALAWKLDVPLHRVQRRFTGEPAVLFALAGGPVEAALIETEPTAAVLGGSDLWTVYAVRCDRPA